MSFSRLFRFHLADKRPRESLCYFNIDELSEHFPRDFLEYAVNNATYDDMLDYTKFEEVGDYPYDHYIDLALSIHRALNSPDYESLQPRFDELFSLGGPVRNSPIAVNGKWWTTDVYEITFPKGYTKVEHLPPELKLCNPLDPKDVWLTHKATSAMKDGHLVVTVWRHVYRVKAVSLSADYYPFLRDWNRRATSLDVRTVTVRKGE